MLILSLLDKVKDVVSFILLAVVLIYLTTMNIVEPLDREDVESLELQEVSVPLIADLMDVLTTFLSLITHAKVLMLYQMQDIQILKYMEDQLEALALMEISQHIRKVLKPHSV